MITIIFGDSIAWGAFDLFNGGWVEQYKTSLFPDKENFVYNCSVSGNTSTNVLYRIKQEIIGRIDPDDDLRIIFAFGINDAGKRDQKHLVTLETFKGNLLEIIKIVKKYTDDIHVVGLTPVNESLSTPVAWDDHLFYENDSINTYDENLKAFSSLFGLNYIPMSSVLTHDDLADGTHPNASGHTKMFQHISAKIK